MSIFCQKNIHSHKKTLFSHYFLKFLHEKPPAFTPTLSLKTSIMSKLNYYGPKKSIGCPLFLIFNGKITALMLYFETFIL